MGSNGDNKDVISLKNYCSINYFTHQAGLDISQIYEAGTWTWGPTLPYKAKFPGLAQIGDHEFILFGGFHFAKQRSTYIYNFETDTWTQLADMPDGR